ncbi:sensor histidine kinase [Nonomuraea angiospora]|uniref:histidine kinase n=1 Tax=Nonomuraea angiospora TaxID=46172 RepID=A0ABR9M854_9ACTN|nr:ATP-binding protein [Nonomuraea angiospora]MBE1589084.1 signal transduction histidine kinase [Nonomuraea angiospora]
MSPLRKASAALSSVRLRATAAATLVVALALGLAALALVAVLRGTLQNNADAEATRKAVAAAPYAETMELMPATPLSRVVEPPGESSIAITKDMTKDVTKEGDGGPVAVVGKSGKVQLRDGITATIADPDLLLTDDKSASATEWAAPQKYAVAGVKVATASGPAMVWSRVPLEGAEKALQTLYSALLPGVPAVLLVVAGMTWISVGRALAPVAAIRTKVADITARDLHQRVPVPGSKDEIAALATTVNGTLDRLETAVDTHKRFVADAAHELRSPIATLRARLELAEPSELTREALADVERLQSLAADLLILAKLDAGEPLRAAELDLGQVAAEESVRARRRPEVRLELDIEPDVVMKGSRAHLDRLMTNLADNAVRHAASTVRVRVHAEEEQAVLEVQDDGPGIPPEQREAVFARFTRLDEARARDAGGAGLGLAIARDIAHLHGGTLVYADSGFIAKFPLNR